MDQPETGTKRNNPSTLNPEPLNLMWMTKASPKKRRGSRIYLHYANDG